MLQIRPSVMASTWPSDICLKGAVVVVDGMVQLYHAFLHVPYIRRAVSALGVQVECAENDLIVVYVICSSWGH